MKNCMNFSAISRIISYIKLFTCETKRINQFRSLRYEFPSHSYRTKTDKYPSYPHFNRWMLEIGNQHILQAKLPNYSKNSTKNFPYFKSSLHEARKNPRSPRYASWNHRNCYLLRQYQSFWRLQNNIHISSLFSLCLSQSKKN